MRRGDLAWADLIPRSGSEQRGRRPVIIISHDGFNRTPNWRSIIVIPVSSSPKAFRGPTSIFLPAGTGGLIKDSFALCHQITTLDRSKITETIGRFKSEILEKIENGIKAAIDIM